MAIIETLIATVISVHDGDTLTARVTSPGPERTIKVRLVEIDAPERTQPYARMATEALKALCVGKPAEIDSHGPDRYGRILGRVRCAGVDANASQVQHGWAWAFDRYLTDPSIKTLESAARDAHRGLWRSPNPVAPWDFRHPESK